MIAAALILAAGLVLAAYVHGANTRDERIMRRRRRAWRKAMHGSRWRRR